MVDISVLISAYQTPPAYLREAVASALAQNVPDLEVLVVDDGSDPPLDTHLSAVADPRLVYHRIPHRGLPGALIEGLERARGRYIAILDHDDRLTPDSLRVRWEAIRASGAGLVYGDLQLIDGTGHLCGEQRFPDIPERADLIRACLLRAIGPLKHGAVLMDARVARAVGNYDPALPAEYDLDLIVRIIQAAGHQHIGVPVVQYRVHPGNFSGSFRYRLRQIFYRWQVMDRHLPAGPARWLAKAWVAFVHLGKAVWQALTYRRPGRLLGWLGR